MTETAPSLSTNTRITLMNSPVGQGGLRALQQRDGAGMRVILVDDNELFLEKLTEQLARKRGVEVVARATNGADGIRLATELKPDVVVVDLAMPGMNGLEVAQLLKDQPHPPRVVVLSLYDEPEYREHAQRAGVDAYLAKSDAHADLVPLLCALCK
ncbi:MAG: response regulator transcription factor [Gammaproteobacteria bacterium]